MKKITLQILFVLAILITGIVFLSKVVGYVLIVLPGSTVEIPIWFFFVLTLSLVLFFYFILNLVRWLWTLSARFRAWTTKRREIRARHSLQQAVFSLLAHNPERALKKLSRAKEFHADPFYLNLVSVFTQHQTGHYLERNNCLQHLRKDFPKENMTLSLFQARLQIDENNLSAAQLTLEKADIDHPHHPQILSLLAQVYLQQKQIALLARLLPSLEKICDAALYANYEQVVAIDRLSQSSDARSLLLMWKKISAPTQIMLDVLTVYVTQLLKLNLTPEAELVVRKQIESHPQPELYLLYAHISHDASQQIAHIENWLKKQKEKDANLLFAAGQICLRFQLWGKARDYFISSLEHTPAPKVYAQLAQLYAQLGDQEKAANCYQLGLSLAVK
jgi:HemY protein